MFEINGNEVTMSIEALKDIIREANAHDLMRGNKDSQLFTVRKHEDRCEFILPSTEAAPESVEAKSDTVDTDSAYEAYEDSPSPVKEEETLYWLTDFYKRHGTNIREPLKLISTSNMFPEMGLFENEYGEKWHALLSNVTTTKPEPAKKEETLYWLTEQTKAKAREAIEPLKFIKRRAADMLGIYEQPNGMLIGFHDHEVTTTKPI